VGYFALALFVAGIGFIIAWLAELLHLPLGGNAGLLAGALTSTPTLAAPRGGALVWLPCPPD
jgi:uncharacterized transporter YbjL